MEIEIGDLVQEICHNGISLGFVQKIFEETGNRSNTVQLCTTYNNNLIWDTYVWALKFNYGKMALKEVYEKYPERFI